MNEDMLKLNSVKNMERLNKYISSCGVSSRRKADELIKNGRVSVNGNIITLLGAQVSDKDVVFVDGKQIFKETKVYYALNKPTGYVTTVTDEHDRRTVMDLFSKKDLELRIFPIGRLDYDTSGILLFTNDGELTKKLISSSNNIQKEYQARIDGIITAQEINKLQNGVIINGVKTKKCQAYLMSKDKINNSCLVKIIISEGKYHQVRLMFEAVGHKVKKLTRTRFANITTEGLKKGEYRKLSIHEVKQLYGL